MVLVLLRGFIENPAAIFRFPASVFLRRKEKRNHLSETRTAEHVEKEKKRRRMKCSEFLIVIKNYFFSEGG
jgi:hypothetical protein